MKTDQAFNSIMQQLERRIADLQSKLMLLHANPDVLYPDDMDFRELKKRLGVAENYLFEIKRARAYLKGISND